MAKMQIQVLSGDDGWHWWRLAAANGEVLAHSQGYKRKWSAKRTATKLARLLQCDVVEVEP